MVDRIGPALAFEAEQAPAERLVVVHEVEVVARGCAVPRTPASENDIGSGKLPVANEMPSATSGSDLYSQMRGLAHREVVVVGVEARQLVQGDRGRRARVGLSGEDLDVVAEIDERLREVADVDALAADGRLAPVGEQGDSQRLRSRRPGGLVHVWASLPCPAKALGFAENRSWQATSPAPALIRRRPPSPR